MDLLVKGNVFILVIPAYASRRSESRFAPLESSTDMVATMTKVYYSVTGLSNGASLSCPARQ